MFFMSKEGMIPQKLSICSPYLKINVNEHEAAISSH